MIDQFITWLTVNRRAVRDSVLHPFTGRPRRGFDPDKPTPSPAGLCHCGGMTPLVCFLSGPGGVKALQPTRENPRRSRPRTPLCFPQPSLPAEVREWRVENR